MRVLVWGFGYVGSVSAACFAEICHTVVGSDTDESVLKSARQGVSPTGEPQLNSLLQKGILQNKLTFTADGGAHVADADVSLICVGTPCDENGQSDFRAVESVARAIGKGLKSSQSFHTIVVRSTMTPGTIRRRLVPILEHESGKRVGEEFGVAVNPEFLREGSAVADFLEPACVVLGEWDVRSGDAVARLYQNIRAPIYRVTLEEGEMVKLVNSTFHSLKIGFANEVGRLCETMDVSGPRVMEILCADAKLNISPAYLRPGFAFGGSCLPKDLRAITNVARAHSATLPILENILPSNDQQIATTVRAILSTNARKIAVFGVSFKAGTGDVCESPILTLISRRRAAGVAVRAFDTDVVPGQMTPRSERCLTRELPDFTEVLCATAAEAMDGAEAIVLCHNRAEYTDFVRGGERFANAAAIAPPIFRLGHAQNSSA